MITCISFLVFIFVKFIAKIVLVVSRYKGYLNSITFEDPRYPLTGPIEFRGDHKKYPLKSSLVKGK